MVASSAHRTAMQAKSSAFPGTLCFSSFQTFSMLIFIACCASVVLTSVHFVSTDSVGLWLHRTDPNLSVTVPPGMHLSAPQSVLKIRTAHFFSDFTFHSVQTSPQSKLLHKIPCQTGDGKKLVFRDVEITHQLAESAVDRTRNIGSGSSEYEHYLPQRMFLKNSTNLCYSGSYSALSVSSCMNFATTSLRAKFLSVIWHRCLRGCRYLLVLAFALHELTLSHSKGFNRMPIPPTLVFVFSPWCCPNPT